MGTATSIALFMWSASLVIRPVFAEDLPSVEEVRERLKEWRQDLVAFRLRYETGAAEDEGRMVRDFLMTDSHDYLDTQERFSPDAPPTKKVSGGNAEARFMATYVSPDDGKSWKLISVHDFPRLNSRVGSGWEVMPLAVMLHPHSGLWMDEDYFSENDVKVMAREDVDGETCVVLDVTYKRNGEIDGNGSRVWLAQNKDFLIKKLRPNDGPPTGRRDANYLCTEFKMTGDKWYPSQGVLLLPPHKVFWKVTAFDVNPHINASLFRAPSKSGLVARRKQPGPKAATDNASARIPDATPRNPQVLIMSGFGILICILGVGGWCILNRSRDSA